MKKNYKLYLPIPLRQKIEEILFNNPEEEDINKLTLFALKEVLPLIGVYDIDGVAVSNVEYKRNTGEICITLQTNT